MRNIAPRAVIPALCALFVAWALAQGYDFDYDILNYHFYNGFALLAGRVFENAQVAMVQTWFPPLADAAFYLGATALPPMLLTALIAAWQSTAFPLALRLGRAVLPAAPALPVGAVVLGALAPVWLWEAGAHRGDTDTAPLNLLALLLALTAPAGATMPLAAAGALAGLAAALKLTNMIFAAGLVAAVLAGPQPSARRLGACAAGFAVAFLLAEGPWALALWRHVGNPVFPALNQIFRSPYAAAASYADPFFALPTLADKLLFLPRHTPLLGPPQPAGLFDARLLLAIPACLLALPGLAVGPGTPRRGLLAYMLVAFAAWLCLFPVNRYLATLDLLAPLALLACIPARGLLQPGALAALALLLPLSAWHNRSVFLLPETHRHGNAGGYFGVTFDPPPGLDRATVALLGEAPTGFLVPFFPETTRFLRLWGSVQQFNLAFNWLPPDNTPAQRRAAMGDAMGALICRRLDAAEGPLFLLRAAAADTQKDIAALRFYGLADAGPCQQIASKSGLKLRLCPARRLPDPECHGGG